MPDPGILRLVADFKKPKPPKGWKEYLLWPVPEWSSKRTDSLAAEKRSDGVTIVHKMSVDDYHLQTEIASGITDLDSDVIQEFVDEQRQKARRQLPRPTPGRDAKGRFQPVTENM